MRHLYECSSYWEPTEACGESFHHRLWESDECLWGLGHPRGAIVWPADSPSFRLFSLSLSCLRATVAHRSAEWRSGCCKAEIHYPNKYMKNAAAAGCECRWKSTTLFRLELKGKKTPKTLLKSNEENSQSLFLFSFHFLALLIFLVLFFSYLPSFLISPLSRPLLRNIGEFFFPIRIFAHSIQG